MTILESFDGSSRKPKKMNATKKIPRKTKIALKYTARTENHGHKKVSCSLVLSEFFAAFIFFGFLLLPSKLFGIVKPPLEVASTLQDHCLP